MRRMTVKCGVKKCVSVRVRVYSIEVLFYITSV